METICMKCQILCSPEKNENNIINLSSAELAQRVVNATDGSQKKKKKEDLENVYKKKVNLCLASLI